MSKKARLQKAWTRYFKRLQRFDIEHPECAFNAFSGTPARAATAYSRRSCNCTPKEFWQRMDKWSSGRNGNCPSFEH